MHAFFYQLYTLQWIWEAEGAQLEGIGNIVNLSRTEALIWLNFAGLVVPMDDDLYRMYLWFKIFFNTSEATYGDIVRTLRMFWSDTPLYYSEYIDIPATMFFTTEPMDIWETDLRVLRIVTRVKAAGVALHFIIPSPPNMDVGTYFATGSIMIERQYIICDQYDLPTDSEDFHSSAPELVTREYIVIDGEPLGGDISNYAGSGGEMFVRENIVVDNSVLFDDEESFAATSTNKIMKENIVVDNPVLFNGGEDFSITDTHKIIKENYAVDNPPLSEAEPNITATAAYKITKEEHKE